MRDNLHDQRKSYGKGELTKDVVDPNPMQQFRTWFYQVQSAGRTDEPNAMTLTTIGRNNTPKGRVVLLKNYDEKGFVFYTNYDSQKGKAIAYNPNVCLSFFWPDMERQVIIEGVAKKTSETESINYFHSRPKGSQIGAYVSAQSEVIDDRNELEVRLNELMDKYKHREVPKPENWGGYVIAPKRIEFWQGRPNRLHDRIVYTLENIDWLITRLQP
ncbi:MAG: pyridoxamine 5'-phosphate oxidase [Candidatus Latescibacterota bacterium]|jgi:pyridoxamine 5'-phosphate oxidase